jgi:prepilin-type N-terminal cleavage/methylation domain-containing protein
MHTLHKKGFTLIETLVAVTILMIAIAGPLTVAMKAYTASLDARNQTIATSLAQETMEYLNYVKDNGPKNNNSGFQGFIQGNDCNSSGNTCDILFNQSDGSLSYGSCSGGACVLRNSAALGYNHGAVDASNKITPFIRYFYLGNVPASAKQTLATVVVSWNTGSTHSDVTLQEVLANVPR